MKAGEAWGLAIQMAGSLGRPVRAKRRRFLPWQWVLTFEHGGKTMHISDTRRAKDLIAAARRDKNAS